MVIAAAARGARGRPLSFQKAGPPSTGTTAETVVTARTRSQATVGGWGSGAAVDPRCTHVYSGGAKLGGHCHVPFQAASA